MSRYSPNAPQFTSAPEDESASEDSIFTLELLEKKELTKWQQYLIVTIPIFPPRWIAVFSVILLVLRDIQSTFLKFILVFFVFALLFPFEFAIRMLKISRTTEVIVDFDLFKEGK